MAGGGGYGDPLKREPESVRQDVASGLVSLQSARDDYGVVITASKEHEIDIAATEALRGAQSIGSES